MSDRLVADFCNRRAWNLRWKSRKNSADLATQALSDATSLDMPEAVIVEGLAHRTLAWQNKWRGQFEDSEQHCQRALQRLDKSNQWAAIGDVYSVLGVLNYSRGRHDLAKSNVFYGYQMLEREDCVATRIDLLTTEATTMRYAKRYEVCQRLLQEALDLSFGVEKARVYHNIARSLDYLDNPSEALDSAMMAMVLARQFENRVVLPYALEVLGSVLRKLGRYEEALKYLAEGEEIGTADNDLRVVCQILQQRAIIEDELGDQEAAFNAAKRGEEVARSMGYSLWEKRFLRHIGEMSERLGFTANALEAFKKLLALETAEHH